MQRSARAVHDAATSCCSTTAVSRWLFCFCRRRRLSTSTSTSTSTADGGGLRGGGSSSGGGGGGGEVHFDDGSGEKLAEVLDHALAKPQSSSNSSSSPPPEPSRILTTRREALSLYRSIWRATALFTWRTDAGSPPSSSSSPPPSTPGLGTGNVGVGVAGSGAGGELWRDALRRSARAEFEAARRERDPLVVARMLVVGRDAVAQAVERVAAKAQEAQGALEKKGDGGGGGGGGRGAPPFR